jgi:hypothetical protein
MSLRTLKKTSVGKIVQPPEIKLSEGKLEDQTVHLLNLFMKSMTRKLNGHITFGNGGQSEWAGNFYGQFIEFTTPVTPDEEFIVDHGLGIDPVGRLVVRQDTAAILYDSNIGSWNKTSVYLKCDTASVLFKILLF